MPLLAWRNKTAPALVPYYDEAKGVVLLRVVKKAQRQSNAIQIPSKLTSATTASHESYSSSQSSEHGLYSSEGEAIQSVPNEVQTDLVTSQSNIQCLYSSEGEAIQSFPVEVQTDLLTSKRNTQSTVTPRFVYCKELNQNILEKIDFVDLRCEQNEGDELKKNGIHLLERQSDPSLQRETQAAEVGPREQIRGEPLKPGNLLDMFSLGDPDTATLGSESSSEEEEDADNYGYPQTPPTVGGFSVLCSPIFAFSSTAARPVPFSAVRHEVHRPSATLSFDDSTWASEPDELHELPGMLDNVLDHMDRALGDFDDEEDTLEGESLFGPREYVRPVGVSLIPLHNRANAGEKSALWLSSTEVNHKASRRQTVFEVIVGALWAKKRGDKERSSVDVKSDDDNRGEAPTIPATKSLSESFDDMVETFGPRDERDEDESLLDDDSDDETCYTF